MSRPHRPPRPTAVILIGILLWVAPDLSSVLTLIATFWT